MKCPPLFFFWNFFGYALHLSEGITQVRTPLAPPGEFLISVMPRSWGITLNLPFFKEKLNNFLFLNLETNLD
jgi:hypothetical protein